MTIPDHEVRRVIAAMRPIRTYQEVATITRLSIPEIKRCELNAVRKIMEEMLRPQPVNPWEQ